MIMQPLPFPTTNTQISNMSKVVENKPYNPHKTTPACIQHTHTHTFPLYHLCTQLIKIGRAHV